MNHPFDLCSRLETSQYLSALLICLILTCAPVARGAADNNVDLQVLLDRYFSALQSGDTQDLRHLLGGALKKKRQHLFANLEYADELKRKYVNSRFTVQSVNPISDTLTAVIIVINTGDEIIKKQLFVANSLENTSGLNVEIVEERVAM